MFLNSGVKTDSRLHALWPPHLEKWQALRAIQTSLVTQMVKNLPVRQETWVRSLGWEDPLEKEMATHSSIFAWRIPWTEEPGRLRFLGSQKSQTQLSDQHFHWGQFRISLTQETHIMWQYHMEKPPWAQLRYRSGSFHPRSFRQAAGLKNRL